jgi:PTH1 family peptidyl-tRNA hydrolase
MALFQKKPQFSSSAPLYSVGAHKTVLIVGLGNPGKKYGGTRHNIGYATLDHFSQANDFPAWTNKKDLKAELSVNNLGSNRVLLAKPTTFMNLSGEAVNAIQQFYKVPNSQTLVVYDELEIPFGQIRTRVGGSDAGHNGVKSLIQHIGQDFSRLRLGIGNEQAQKVDAADFVLKKFSKEEQGHLPMLLQECSSIITEFVFGGELPHDTRTVL